MKKAVFFDRDGVINKERGEYTFRISDFIINDGIIENFRLLKENDFLLIIISNQGGIAKGIYKAEDVDLLQRHFESILKKENLTTDGFYYCPHYTEEGNCICRKPDTLLIEKAIYIHDLDVSKSFFIGDSQRDIDAGKKAGLKTFLIEPNTSISDICKIIIKI